MDQAKRLKDLDKKNAILKHLIPNAEQDKAFLLGAQERSIMQSVGHRNSRIVARYCRLRDDDGQQTMQRLNFLQSDKCSDGPTSKA